MTAQGSPRTRFARAINTRNVLLAEIVLGELEHVQLEDALQLVYLQRQAGLRRFRNVA